MKRWIVPAAVTLVAAAVGTASATMSSPGGVIHGCVKQFGGALRIIDADKERCGGRERPISWNAEGPQGPSGVSGYEIVAVTISRASVFSSAFGFDALCPAGKKAVGGGGSANITTPAGPFPVAPLRVVATGPTADGEGWRTSFGMADGSFFPDGRTINVFVEAVCVNAG